MGHVRCADVVRDTVGPCAQGTAAIESCEAAPESDVNVLQEITADLGVGLVSASQTFEGSAEFVCGLLIERALRRGLRDGLNCAHS